MKYARLLSAVAATLLLTAGAALAQDVKKDEAPARAPAALRNAPAEIIAPSMNAGENNAVTNKPPVTTDANGSANKSSGSATTGQGAGAGTAILSAEQRSKFSAIFKQRKVESAHLNVSVSVGTRLPVNVRVYPVPVEIITAYPVWAGYDFVMAGNQILIVDPLTHEIVAILEA